MTNAEDITDEYNRLNVLKREIDKLKKEYKLAKEQFDNGLLDEETKKVKGQLLLGKEYEYGKIKDSIAQRNGTYTSPKIGDWIVSKGRFGFKRIKVLVDDNCGWS